MAPQLTPAQREQIITLSNNGCGVSDIQKRTGIARKTVYFWLRRYEETGGDLIAYRREFDYRATTAAQDAAIIAAHKNEPTRSTKDTASEFNVSRETVRRRIKESLGHRKPKVRKHRENIQHYRNPFLVKTMKLKMALMPALLLDVTLAPPKGIAAELQIKRVVDQNAMPVTEKQLEVLVEFAEHNLDLALSCHLKGSLAAVETQNAWKELTLRLNSLPGGINKTAERWRRYWIDVKSKIRNKANSQRFLELSCGTPSPLEISCGPYDIPLSADLEERVLAIIRQGAGYKSPTIEIPAFALPDTSSQSSTSPRLTPSKQDDTPSETIHPTPASPETRNSSPSSPETEDPNPLPPEVKKHPSSSPDAARDCLPEPKVEMEWLENLANSSIPKKEHEVWTVIPPAPAIAHDNHGGRCDWTLPEHVPRWAVELEERRAATEERLTAAVESISNNLNQIAANVKELLTHVKK